MPPSTGAFLNNERTAVYPVARWSCQLVNGPDMSAPPSPPPVTTPGSNVGSALEPILQPWSHPWNLRSSRHPMAQVSLHLLNKLLYQQLHGPRVQHLFLRQRKQRPRDKNKKKPLWCLSADRLPVQGEVKLRRTKTVHLWGAGVGG